MSVNQFLDAVPFSVSGLQNLQVNSINGGGFITAINIAGQIAYLSWNSTTETLTLLIPNANGSTTGLLTSTDWNTFNNKENLLTFSSPLTRVGNTVSFDFSTANFWTGVNTFQNLVSMTGYLNHTGDGVKLSIGNFVGADFSITDNTTSNDIVKVENDGTKIDILNYLRTGGKFKIINALTGIDFMDLDFNIAQTLFNTDMLFRGGYVVVENQFFVENRINTPLPMVIHRNILLFPGQYLYFNVAGKIGYYDGTDKWTIDRFGQFDGGSIIVNDFIQATNNISSTGGGISGRFLFANPVSAGNTLDIRRGFSFPNEYLFYNTNGELGVFNGSTNAWKINTDPVFLSVMNIGSIQASSTVNATGNIITSATVFSNDVQTNTLTSANRIVCTNSGLINRFRLSHFEPTNAINNWIATSHSYDGVDKPVIGNLGLAVGGFGTCIGGHNSSLSAWTDFWVNPGATTYINSLVVTGSFTPPSDRRLKSDISYLDAGKSINFIKRLKPCIYKRIDKPELPNYTHPEQKLQHGFIADEIEEVAETEAQKALVGRMKFAGYDDCKNLAVLNLIPEMVQGMKELIDKNEKLETENKILIERLDAIELKMKKITQLVGINV